MPRPLSDLTFGKLLSMQIQSRNVTNQSMIIVTLRSTVKKKRFRGSIGDPFYKFVG